MTFSAALIAEYHGLRRYAFKLTRSQEDCDDLVQDTALRAIERAHQFELGTNMGAWLRTIMHNVFMDRRRRGKLAPVATDDAILAAISIGPSSQNIRVQAGEVLDAVERLPPRMRKVLVPIAMGESYLHVSETLGINLGTVRSRLSRAREALRAGL